MDPFIQRFQPELYEKWMRNLDIAPHPEDPPEIAERVLARARNPLQYAKGRSINDVGYLFTVVILQGLPPQIAQK